MSLLEVVLSAAVTRATAARLGLFAEGVVSLVLARTLWTALLAPAASFCEVASATALSMVARTRFRFFFTEDTGSLALESGHRAIMLAVAVASRIDVALVAALAVVATARLTLLFVKGVSSLAL